MGLIRSAGILLFGNGERAAAVRVPRIRIIDGRSGTAEIAAPNVGSRNRIAADGALALACRIPASKEEQLVLDDRTTERHTIVVVDAERLVHARRLKEVARLQMLIVVEFKSASVELVG